MYQPTTVEADWAGKGAVAVVDQEKQPVDVGADGKVRPAVAVVIADHHQPGRRTSWIGHSSVEGPVAIAGEDRHAVGAGALVGGHDIERAVAIDVTERNTERVVPYRRIPADAILDRRLEGPVPLANQDRYAVSPDIVGAAIDGDDIDFAVAIDITRRQPHRDRVRTGWKIASRLERAIAISQEAGDAFGPEVAIGQVELPSPLKSADTTTAGLAPNTCFSLGSTAPSPCPAKIETSLSS